MIGERCGGRVWRYHINKRSGGVTRYKVPLAEFLVTKRSYDRQSRLDHGLMYGIDVLDFKIENEPRNRCSKTVRDGFVIMGQDCQVHAWVLDRRKVHVPI